MGGARGGPRPVQSPPRHLGPRGEGLRRGPAEPQDPDLHPGGGVHR